MDTLDHFFDLAQLSGSVDIHCLFQGDWQVRHEPGTRSQGRLHIVVNGRGSVQIDHYQTIDLSAGDIVFFPRAHGHSLSHVTPFSSPINAELQAYQQSAQQAQTRRIDSDLQITQAGAFQRKQCGQGPVEMELCCGRFCYDSHADLSNNLPDYIHLECKHPSLISLIHLLQAEASQTQSGSRSIINGVSTVILALIIRQYLSQSTTDELSGVLRAWQDHRLQAAIQAVIQEPHKAWPIDAMRSLSHLSRPQFMRLFKQETGLSPHAFVTHVRLQKAAQLLSESNHSILSIALSLGLQSETHFGKSFKKQYGLTPGSYRQHALQAHTKKPLSAVTA